MSKREVIGRYRGSVLGLAWSFFNPLIMLVVYTFVFSIVFKARWQTGSDSKTEFALALFIGMIVHGLLAECVNRAPSLIVGNVNYVKKVIFPLEVLPWIAMGATLFHTLISLVVWGLFFVLVNQTFYWTALFLPLLFLPLILVTMGMTWFLASCGVYLRDVGQITGVFTMVLLFMSPVFYPISNLPERIQPLMYANPLTFIIEQSRAVLMWGQFPNWGGVCISFVISAVVAWLGFAWFQKTRRGFADVL
ncbi:MAG: ABC transporter permease [Gimesia sp.]|nr:ABC transporter permease [Gimesia sp.]